MFPSAKIDKPATHIGIATDHIIESFRNRLYEGYKTGDGIEPELYSQFPILEEALDLAGFKVWAMVEYEADDALATAAARFAKDKNAEQIFICTPDKDLAQCLTPDNRVLQFDRRKQVIYKYEDTLERFGVLPESIPDNLALMGDSADGFPGLAGFGAKTSSTLCRHYKSIEKIPKDAKEWAVDVRGAEKLAATFREHYEDALLFKKIATCARDVPDIGTLEDLRWKGVRPGFSEFCKEIDAEEILKKI